MLKSKVKTKVKDKGFKRAIKAIQIAAAGPKVKVGVLSIDGVKVASGDSLNLAGIASVNEFGTKNAGKNGNIVIPARPFMSQTMDGNFRKYNRQTESIVVKILKGELTIEQGLDLLGVVISADLKKTITTLSSPPNAPSTIRAKRSSNPLIDTGRLRSSMNYEVEVKPGVLSILNNLVKGVL